MRTTSTPEGPVLADAARVLAARRSLDPLLARLADAPLDPGAVGALRVWIEESYPPAAAALDRLRASGATAPPHRRARPRGLAPAAASHGCPRRGPR
jgi:hypothetical protein